MVDCRRVHTDERQFTDLNTTLNMSIIQCFGLLTNLCSKTAADVQFAQSFDIIIEPGYSEYGTLLCRALHDEDLYSLLK